MIIKFEFDTKDVNFDRRELSLHTQAEKLYYVCDDIANQVENWRTDGRTHIPVDEIYEVIKDIMKEVDWETL